MSEQPLNPDDPVTDAAVAPSSGRPALFRHEGFRLLLGGQALSQLGFQFSGLAMPVVAVTMLHASEAQMG